MYYYFVDALNFSEVAKKVSSALWSGKESILDDLSREYSASDEEVSNKLESGNFIRSEKDYYFGSAFYYEKELYWGVDRLHHLEDRLIELGLKKDSIKHFPAIGDASLCGVIVDCNIETGLANKIESYICGGQLKNT